MLPPRPPPRPAAAPLRSHIQFSESSKREPIRSARGNGRPVLLASAPCESQRDRENDDSALHAQWCRFMVDATSLTVPPSPQFAAEFRNLLAGDAARLVVAIVAVGIGLGSIFWQVFCW